MFSNSFIFSVNAETYETHRKYGFCATGNSNKPIAHIDNVLTGDLESSHYKILSNILNVRDGDIVFFYVEKIGFKGIYKACQAPFFDPTTIESVPSSRPFRIRLECLHHFDNPVSENELFATPERQRTFWLWYHNKLRQGGRGCTPLDPDARDTLIKLLIQHNGGQESTKEFPQATYPNSHALKEIKTFTVKHEPLKRAIRYEGSLEAMLMLAFRDKSNTVSHLFGNFGSIEWFANQVPCHISGKSIDMLLYHRSKQYLGIDTRYQFTVMELKRETADLKALKQLLDYCEWVSDNLSKGDAYLIQPTLVAYDFDKSVMELAQSEHLQLYATYKPVKLIQYRYDPAVGLELQDILQPDAVQTTVIDPKRVETVTKRMQAKPKRLTKPSASPRKRKSVS